MSDQNPSTPNLNSNSPSPLRKMRHQLEVWVKIALVTLREPIMRISGHIALLVVIAIGVSAIRLGWDTLPTDAATQVSLIEESQPVEETTDTRLSVSDLPDYTNGMETTESVSRANELHTVFPDRPRLNVLKYHVQQGDTLFGIAENFNIKPETVLWGNFEVLQDDAHNLSPGQELNIPPIDGTLYTWHEGDGLKGVAAFFGVESEEILDWPGNELDPTMDPDNPSIESGTLIIVPGGTRALVSWSAPRISRSNPAVAKILGPGACGSLYDGPVGTGTFIWPAPSHYVSGFEYSSVHPAIDVAGNTGNAIFASDSGVVVYSGWNDWGYGYVIVIDHGNGWQTLYAHLSQINVVCGQAVFQANVIGGMGCTGNCSGSHLHFEMMHDDYGKVNPWNFLP